MSAHVRALRKLGDMKERVIGNTVWMKCTEFRQFKVSPHGLKGDYEKESFWVDYDDLEDYFTAHYGDVFEEPGMR